MIILIGIPGSGKSTLCQKILKVNSNYIRVNRDNIREMLFAFHPSQAKKYWDRSDLNTCEKLITTVEGNLIKTLLQANKTPVIDNTNLSLTYINRYINIAKEFEIEYSLQLVNTDVKLCIQRDQQRERTVGKDLIIKSYNKLQDLLNDNKFKEIWK